MRIGIYAGSFDPPTLGHEDIIARSFYLLDKLIIGVGIHAEKNAQFPLHRREAMLKKICTPLARKARSKFEIITYDGLLVTLARKKKANVIIRGLRNGTDYDYESQMAMMNRSMTPSLETIFLTASPAIAMVSSTLVRQILKMGGNVGLFLSATVLKDIKKYNLE